ncbi:MAG: hypothetical protein ACYSU0_20630 [Planctomycetota bacterium]|jgi:hypothetical protein
MKATWAVVLIGAISISGCRKRQSAGEAPRLGFITEPGQHIILSGCAELNLYEEDGGMKYRVTRIRGHTTHGVGPGAVPFADKDASWFAYVESTDRFWFCNGEDDLQLVEQLPTVSRASSIKLARDRLVREMPAPVRERLPRALAEPARATGAPTEGEGDAGGKE